MVKHAPDKIFADLAQSTALVSIVEEIMMGTVTAFIAPQAHMNVCAATRLIEERLGGKRREKSKAACHSTYGLTHLAHVIGSAQHPGMTNG